MKNNKTVHRQTISFWKFHTHLVQAAHPHHRHLGVEALVGFEGLWVVVWVGCH